MSAHRNALNPRNTIHNVSVQQMPPSYDDPKKRLSHATKFRGSNPRPVGIVQTILKRGRFR